MRRSRWLPPVALVVVVLAGCGGGNVGLGSTSQPTASAPDAPAPPADATQPGTGPVTTPAQTQTAPARTQPQARTQRQVHRRVRAPVESGGGSQPVRVPATFVAVGHGRLTPPTITIPPFLAVEISLRSRDRKPHELVLRAPVPHALQVGPGGTARMRIPGLRTGRYAVLLDGHRAGALVVGGDGGP